MQKVIFILVFFFFSFFAQGQKDDLGKQLQRDLESARATNNYHELAAAYSQLALYEEATNSNLELSFAHLSRSLEYYELISDSSGINVTEYHIARQLLQNGMTKEAYERLIKLRSYFSRLKDNYNLALVELQLFDYYFDKLDVDRAAVTLSFIDKRLGMLDQHELELDLISRRIVYYQLLKDYKQALAAANLCIEKSAFTNTQNDYAHCLLLRGRVQYDLGQYEEAILDLSESQDLLSRFPYSKKRLQAYDLLSKSYSALELIEPAYSYAQSYAALQDSILNEKRLIAINNLTYKYESKEKATEIKLLEKDKAFVQQSNQQQKRALVVLGIALGGLILGIYYIVRFYSDKIKSAKIIEEQNEKINQQKINELEDRMQINSMQSMIAGQEVERERIAKDLHDSLGGLISTIKLQIGSISNKSVVNESIPEIEHATKLLDVAVSEIRTISQDLQPGALKRLGLVPAINDLVNRYQSQTGPEITFQHYDLPKEMDQGFALGIYRIVQEILNNAIKHAKATEVFVQLNKEGDDIVIHVEDDGIGFDPNKKYNSMGLANIRSRVNYLKGSIDIDSRINEGTSFIIHLSSKFYKTAVDQS